MIIHKHDSCHIEAVTLSQLSNRKPGPKIRIDVNLEYYYKIKDKKQGKQAFVQAQKKYKRSKLMLLKGGI